MQLWTKIKSRLLNRKMISFWSFLSVLAVSTKLFRVTVGNNGFKWFDPTASYAPWKYAQMKLGSWTLFVKLY